MTHLPKNDVSGFDLFKNEVIPFFNFFFKTLMDVVDAAVIVKVVLSPSI